MIDLPQAQKDETEQWDSRVKSSSLANSLEMWYCDAADPLSGKNYLDSLLPEKIKTAHLAYLVDENELPYLYLSFDHLTGENMEEVLVDIRQQ